MTESTASEKISIPHLVAVFLGALCIAFAPIFVVLAKRLGGVGMWDAAFWRVFLGAIAIGVGFLIARRSPITATTDLSGRNKWMWLWLPGLFFGADFWAWHWSFDHTTVANSTLLANTSIIFVTLFAWWVWKEKITRLFIVGAVVAFGGMALLVLSSTQREPPPGGIPIFGDSMALVTAVFYGSYQLSIKNYRRHHSAFSLLFWASLVASIVLFPAALLQSDPFMPNTASGWGMLLGVGLLSHAGGQGLIAYGLGKVPSSLAAVVLLVQPVLTCFLGVILLGQDLVTTQLFGAILVVVGLGFAISEKVRK